MLISRHVFIVARCQLHHRNEADVFHCRGQTGQTNHLNDFLLFLLQLLHSKETHTNAWFSRLHSAHGPRSFTKLYRSAQSSLPLLSSPHLIKQRASCHSLRLGVVWQKSIYLSVHGARDQGNLKPLLRFNTNLPDESHIKWDQRFPLSYCVNSKWNASMYNATQRNALRQCGLYSNLPIGWERGKWLSKNKTAIMDSDFY